MTPEDFSHPPRKYNKEEQREIILSLYKIHNEKIGTHTWNQTDEFLRNNYTDFQIDNPSYKQMFFYECMRYEDEVGEERINQLHHAFNVKGSNLDGSSYENESTSTPTNSYPNPIHYDGSDFFSILETAIREADRKWREDEFEQQNKGKKKKRQKGIER